MERPPPRVTDSHAASDAAFAVRGVALDALSEMHYDHYAKPRKMLSGLRNC